jgi:hypothetical protein
MRERCGLAAEPQNAPKFAFDEAALQSPGRNVLDDVARCLTEGPLKGETITLVGRADERGSEQYNRNLGASRAASARDYLFQRGVPAEQMRLMSRGEQGARGSDEATYALDRRVDLELGDLRNSPILQGTMMQAETSDAKRPDPSKAASYADAAEGGTVTSEGGTSSPPASGTSSGTQTSGSVQGSVQGSAQTR